ncbi:chemotaxis protein CheY (plasmid) [Halostagnicola larsenii XH-48]|uniref:Chemotaxis protein CheY n=1 Tax=Halostagnicola larsenii XH-48 TaxID=797299 RepID=W0JY20_9EURY|nr:response regulator [Halostagnicola larsenii]AHG01898.1 chemotaxis protein CheY [Halostagnicola larsenii XH-48]
MSERATGAATDSMAHILLIEDNHGDVRLLQEAMKRADIDQELHVVTDGVEALNFVHQRGEYTDVPSPDFIFLDLNLPQVNGIDVLCELDEDNLTYVPTIILTSSQADKDIRQAYECGANAYLTKPADPDEFVEMVQAFWDFWFQSVELPEAE